MNSKRKYLQSWSIKIPIQPHLLHPRQRFQYKETITITRSVRMKYSLEHFYSSHRNVRIFYNKSNVKQGVRKLRYDRIYICDLLMLSANITPKRAQQHSDITNSMTEERKRTDPAARQSIKKLFYPRRFTPR